MTEGLRTLVLTLINLFSVVSVEDSSHCATAHGKSLDFDFASIAELVWIVNLWLNCVVVRLGKLCVKSHGTYISFFGLGVFLCSNDVQCHPDAELDELHLVQEVACLQLSFQPLLVFHSVDDL